MPEKVLDAYGEEIELTTEQTSCVNYAGEKTLIVKGLAGAGKSVVLEQLARKILEEEGKKSGRKVAILTYQNTLVEATKERLGLNGEDDETIMVATVNKYIKEIYDEMVKMGIAPKVSFPDFKNPKKMDYLIKNSISKSLEDHKKTYGHHSLQNKSIKFWHEEITWMKEMNVWTDNVSYYVGLQRIGRGGSEVKSMSASDKMVAYQIFKIYCDNLAKSRQGDWEDQALFIIRNASRVPEKFRFDKILIDEAQDLTLAQLLVIKVLARKSIAIAMDMNQRIHNKHWNTKLLGIEPVTKKLTKSMRTTKEIDSFAESIRKNNDIFLDDDELTRRAEPERHGELPVVTHLQDELAEEKYVIELLKKLRENEKPLSIGVLAPKNETVTKIGDWLSSAGIYFEKIGRDSSFSVLKKGIKLVSSFSSKGLEFDVIIMPLFMEGNYPYSYNPPDEEAFAEFIVKMRNIVYVSMSRAKSMLYVSYHGKNGSRFIGEMDKALYISKGDVDASTYAVGRKISSELLKRKEKKKSAETISDVVEVVNTSTNTQKSTGPNVSIKEFFEHAGFEVIDNRPEGNLTVVGEKSELEPYVNEAKKIYGAFGGYKENLKSAHGRAGWWTTSKK